MIDLLIAIVLSAIIPNLFKLAQKKECRQPPIITLNYLMCVVIVIANFFISKSQGAIFGVTLTDVEMNSIILSAVIGVVCGVFYYLGFYFFQKAVRQSGAALSSAFGKMGILVPIILSVIIWREYPKALAVVGICLSVFAIFFTYFDFKSFRFNQIHAVLIVLFLFGGMGDFSNKLFQKYCLQSHSMIFLFFIFVSALLASLKDMKSIKNITKNEFIIGLFLGIPNMLTATFLIRALFALPAFIVFPMFSGATIILAMLLSALFYKEIPSRKQLVAICMIIVALVMINL
ncbi:MAG: EamA family transporter [Clostridiales bacterium]|nr:EamA family transporter [Clostridiales bacterium]